ncbi:hypothetical protein BDA96_01G537600 [Sorghum bicolor]|uniref:Uncharacterized protein n=1 Tax=Sorghum bicolor TaxID=4558 RepID=A0A921S653_SORBI|nr:hypothetical protein BDA96_01G537600 [Sorghum bicolor]
MGTYNHLWSIAKRNAMAVVIGISISDRYVAFTSVTGESMYPTFTASSSVWGDSLRSCSGEGYPHNLASIEDWPSGEKDT